MKWIILIMLLTGWWLTGCAGYTIKVEPIKKTPVKQSVKQSVKHHRKHHAHPSVTPAPHPDEIHRPLQLEPTEHPTPIIKITPTALYNQWSMTNV